MKLKHILVTLLTLCLLLTFAACDKTGDPPANDTTAETPTDAPTEAPTDAPTEAPTEEPTEAPTDAPTEEPTEAPTDASDDQPTEGSGTIDITKKYREDWDDDDPNNPFYNLIPVGTSYDGKTTAYDGRYDFGYAICQTNDGEYFYSVQEAVYHLEDIGGGSIHMREHTDICLALWIPEDFCDYRLYYEFKNVDFIFNYGNVYDDNTPNGEGIHGYAYYADLYILDSINGLGDTFIWMIGGNEGFDEPGRYLMIDEYNEDPDYLYLYQYVLESNLEAWPGLPVGEYLPEE
ncbi:MAG: PT domain-containing protein [Clostridia bacterium]|nr:PT domain-containing protein [Clostridia bacterium]